MKKLFNTPLKALSGASLLAITLNVQAQKLPSVQKNGVYAPPIVKIDGKPTEWNRYQAFNRCTEVFYTLSNDDANLYVLIRSENSAITSKILCGGLTFSVAAATEGPDKPAPVEITYPLPMSDGMRQLMSVAINYPNKTPGIETVYAKGSKESDLLLLERNRLLLNNATDISVTGVKEFSDQLLSIYNDKDVKVRATLDNGNHYTCEIAIPLRYVGISGANAALAYAIKVNGPQSSFLGNRVSYGNYVIGRGYQKRDLLELRGTTDLKARYMLAGK